MKGDNEAAGVESQRPGSGLAHSGSRWLPSPQDLWGVAACVLIVIVVYSPVLFGGRSLSGAAFAAYGVEGSDTLYPYSPVPVDVYRLDHGASAWQFEPWAEVVSEIYRSGTVPLWNPHQGTGAPLAANMQSAVFDPFMLAVNLHPSPLMWDLTIVLALVGSAVLTYVFARVIGVGVLGSIVASAGFSLSGFFFLYNNGHIIRAHLYLPVLFICVEFLARSQRFAPVLGLALGVAGVILVGFPEAAVVVVGAATLYGIVRIVEEDRRVAAWRKLAKLSAAIVLGVGLVAPLVLLLAEYVPLSFDTHSSEGVGALQLRGILNLVVPFFNGPPKADSLGVGWSGTRQWIGAGVAMLAIVGVSGKPGTWRRFHTPAFAAVGLVVFLKVYDFYVLEWLGHLPILDSVRFTRDGLPTLAFIAAVLAGIGIEIIHRRDVDYRVLTLLGLAAATGFVLLTINDMNRQFIAATTRTHVLRHFGLAAFVAVVVLIGALAARRWRHGAWVVGLVVVAELLILAPRGNLAERAEPFPPTTMTKTVQRLAAEPPATRVFGFDGKLHPNTAGAYGLYDIGLLDGLLVNRYVTYARAFLEPSVTDRLVGRVAASSDRPSGRYVANPMFDLLGARYLVSASPLPLGEDGKPEASVRLISETDRSLIYENTGALPRAFIATSIHQVPDESAAFAFFENVGRRDNGNALVVTEFNPRREAVIEADEGSLPADLRGIVDGVHECMPSAPAEVAIDEYRSDAVVIGVRTDCPGLLVLSDAWYPGWRAYVNGEWRRSYPTNLAFRGVPVSAGESRVEFRYEPFWWRAGLFISLLTIVALFTWGLVARRRGAATPRERTGPPLVEDDGNGRFHTG